MARVEIDNWKNFCQVVGEELALKAAKSLKNYANKKSFPNVVEITVNDRLVIFRYIHSVYIKKYKFIELKNEV